MICRTDLSDRELYRLEEVAKVDSAALTSSDNSCSSPGARPSPKQDPDESWDFWAERRPKMGQFHPREPSCNIMFRVPILHSHLIHLRICSNALTSTRPAFHVLSQ